MGGQLGPMLAYFSSKTGRSFLRPLSFLLGPCYFSILGPSRPNLGAVWPRFWRVWGSILEVFGAQFPFFNQCLRILIFYKISFMCNHCFSGSGWAGGVTRSAKNSINTLQNVRRNSIFDLFEARSWRIFKFVALRVTPPAHSAPKGLNIAPTWHQNGAKMGPKTSKIEPRWGPEAPKWNQNWSKMGSKRQ